MKPFIFSGDDLHPTVDLNPDTGVLSMSGRCMNESPLKFFEDVFQWLDEYLRQPLATTTFELYIDYFNTNSLKCLLDVLVQSVEAHKEGKTQLIVNWRYHEDDEEMKEVGEDYVSITGHQFTMIEMQD